MPLLDQLQYAKPNRKGPWKLYVFDRDGYHKGGKYFDGNLPDDPDERRYWITRAAARIDVTQALRQGLEVRITDGGDMLVFHAIGGKQLHPVDADLFWDIVGV